MNKTSEMIEALRSSMRKLAKGDAQVSSGKKQTQLGRRVVISSNCQTGGIAAALQVIFPNDEIVPLPLPSFTNSDAESKFSEKISHSDIWVTIGGFELLEKYGMDNRVRLIKIPIIRFSGFHPDLVYAKKISTGELVTPHYNSAIAIWAFKNNLDIDSAEKLFNKTTFTELGYLDHWEESINQLRQRFKNSDLEFSEFILPMRREGLFMYSLNHPKVKTLAWLAKLIAQKMGEGPEVLEKYIDIHDGLNEVIWPVYPNIGDNLSLSSGYSWKMGEGWWLNSLRDFLEYTYENYMHQKIARHDIVAEQVNEQIYNQVLRAQTRINS